MFLEAVGDHPWARLDIVQSYSGLRAWEINDIAQPLAEKHGLIEQGRIASVSGRHPPRRFGLTPAGAAAIGQHFHRPFMGQAFLSALKLDIVRRLLTEFVGEVKSTIWSLSPFHVPVKDLRPARKRSDSHGKKAIEGDYALRNLCLDGLACLKFGAGRYLNVALLVDPGGVRLEWVFHQFRSFQAWASRAEFRDCLRSAPVLIVVAANDPSRAQLIRLWQDAAPWGMSLKRMRMTTRSALGRHPEERRWWDERGRQTLLWGGIATFEAPARRPETPLGGWWGGLASDDLAADPRPVPIRRAVRRRGLIRWASAFRPRPDQKPSRDELMADLVRLHLRLSAREREFLAEVGRYPLISKKELATVLGRSLDDVSHGFTDLLSLNLVERIARDPAVTSPRRAPKPSGQPSPDARAAGDRGGTSSHVLTWLGVALLAAQAGFEPVEYARLMNWPVNKENGRLCYSVEAWLASAEHNRLVLEFLVGLRRHGPARGLSLLYWDHLGCRQALPLEKPLPKGRGWRLLHQGWVIPDAMGTVRLPAETAARQVDIAFWLEVDRGSQRGAQLWEKLRRYYRLGGARGGLVGHLPRLLFVVEGEDEARLQAVRRRLLMLNQQYGIRLDARLTRVDLLRNEKGQLDPTRRVWRTPDSSEFIGALDWERWKPEVQSRL
jgi:hypothetical protein